MGPLCQTKESLLFAYVHFVKDENLVQDLLFARQLETDKRGVSILCRLEFFKEKDIPLSNILACATDGASSMIGHHIMASSVSLKKTVPGVLTVHCVIHRQHLVTKKPK